MTTIAEDLTTLAQIKQELALAIQEKGVSIDGTIFSDFPFKVRQIQNSGSGSYLSKEFLEGTWSYADWSQVLQGFVKDPYYFQLEYDPYYYGTEVLKLVVLTPDVSDSTVCSFRINTTETLDGEGSLVHSFMVDWGDGAVQSFYPGAHVEHSYNNRSGWLGTSVCVTVTPINGGHFTEVDLGVRPVVYPAPARDFSSLMKVYVKGPWMSKLRICNPGVYEHPSLAEAWIGENVVSDMQGLFEGATALKAVFNLFSIYVENFARLFKGCGNLVHFTGFDENISTNYSEMFKGTRSLMSIPNLSMRMATNTQEMFMSSGVVALPEFAVFGQSGPVNARGMFNDCFRLAKLPVINCSNIVDASYMFANCTAAKQGSGYSYYLPQAISGQYMFYNCLSLEKFQGMVAENMVNIESIFENCVLLSFIDLFMANVTNADKALKNCVRLSGCYIQNMPRVVISEFLSGCLDLRSFDSIGPEPKLNYFTLVGKISLPNLLALFNAMAYWDNTMPKNIDLSQLKGIAIPAEHIDILLGKGYTVSQ